MVLIPTNEKTLSERKIDILSLDVLCDPLLDCWLMILRYRLFFLQEKVLNAESDQVYY